MFDALRSHANLRRFLTNVGWLVADKILRLGGGLVVGVLIARHLGPEEFGQWNYALAFASLFGACASLGIDSIVIRDIVREPQRRASLLATSFILKLGAGIFALAAAALTIAVVRSGQTTTLLLVCLSGLGFIFQAAQVVDFDFQAHNNNRTSVIAQNAAFLLMTLVKIKLLVLKAPLLAFAIAGSVEIGLGMAVLLGAFLWRGGRIDLGAARWGVAKRLLKDSWPLMLGGIAVSLYMRIDQVMLGAILDDHAVGIYSAAVRLSEAWYFIPMSIAIAVYPTMIALKNRNEGDYQRRMQQYFDGMYLLGLVAALIVTCVGPYAVLALFGSHYAAAGPLVVLHIWAGIFVSLGVASGTWLNVEELQRYSLTRTALGCTCNIAINFALIPVLGATGAVIGTLLAQCFAVYSLLVFPRTRTCGLMLIKSALPFRRLMSLKPLA